MSPIPSHSKVRTSIQFPPTAPPYIFTPMLQYDETKTCSQKLICRISPQHWARNMYTKHVSFIIAYRRKKKTRHLFERLALCLFQYMIIINDTLALCRRWILPQVFCVGISHRIHKPRKLETHKAPTQRPIIGNFLGKYTINLCTK